MVFGCVVYIFFVINVLFNKKKLVDTLKTQLGNSLNTLVN